MACYIRWDCMCDHLLENIWDQLKSHLPYFDVFGIGKRGRFHGDFVFTGGVSRKDSWYKGWSLINLVKASKKFCKWPHGERGFGKCWQTLTNSHKGGH